MLDSAVMIYALGGDHPYRQPCRLLMGAARAGELQAETTALAVQEVLHQRARRTGDRQRAAAVSRDLATVLVVHELLGSDLRRAIELFAESSALDAADACHAAIALDRGIGTIISPDRAFDAVPGLRRLDPVAASALMTT
ncbi:hypothetical protein BH23ACT9_BH23ACT9_27180 [soil metagenome]